MNRGGAALEHQSARSSIHRLAAPNKLRDGHCEHKPAAVKEVRDKAINAEEVQPHNPGRKEIDRDKGADGIKSPRIDRRRA